MDRVIPPNQQPGDHVQEGIENENGNDSILHIYL